MLAFCRRYWVRPLVLLAPILLVLWAIRLPEKRVEAVFPGQNGRIAFSSEYFNHLWTINPDGSCRLGSFDGAYVAWSPDGKRIAATMETFGGNMEIVVMDTDGSNIVYLTDDVTPDMMPAWSPDGEKIVFVAHRDGNPELYIMNKDGSEQTRLTNSPADELFPAWSPDGNHIAFRSNSTGDLDIFVLDLTSEDPPVNLTNTPGEHESDPDLSPDGAHIVFHSVVDGLDNHKDIFVMDADGSNRTNLTNTSDKGEYSSVWSPDGALIAYLSYFDQGIFTMNPNGSDKKFVSFPYEWAVGTYIDDWQPLIELETTIEIAKIVHGHMGGPWAFSMTGVEPFTLGKNQCKVFSGVTPGSYEVTEEVLPDFDQSVSCNNGASGSTAAEFEITDGERVTCTFVNGKRPNLTIFKQFQGLHTETEWPFVGTGTIGEFTLNEAGGYFKQFMELDAGEYTITEIVPEGYAAVVQCDDFNGSAGEESVTLNLQLGRDVTCTFTNNKLADVTIEKVVVGDAPATDWQFGGDFGEFTLPAAGGKITFQDVPAGNHLIFETIVTGYHPGVGCYETDTGLEVYGVTQPGKIEIQYTGVDTTCTFTNSSQVGTNLTIKKVVVGDAPTTDWEFIYGMSGDFDPFTLPAAGGSITFESLPPGTYDIYEPPVEGYIVSASCDNGSVGGMLGIQTQLTLGLAVTCTFTNTQMALVTITKEVQGDPPEGPWKFNGGDYIGDFELPAAGGTQSFYLPAGTYPFSEAAVEGYSSSVSCNDGTTGESAAILQLDPGDEVTCTFINSQAGSLKIVKVVEGGAANQVWQFDVGPLGEFMLPPAGGDYTFESIAPGNYTIQEASVSGYTVSANCTDDSSGAASVMVDVGAGEAVICTFTNVFAEVDYTVFLPHVIR